MNNLFSYDSKLMQALTTIGDYIILNLLFLLCCIPVVTIGAAQAGLYNGVRVLQDKEDDSSCVAAYFRGFKAGFGRITLLWCLFLVLIAAMTYTLILVLVFDYAGANAPVIMSAAGLVILTMFQSLTVLFHARFDCTAFQLLRNAWLLFFSHPLRSLAVTILAWLPFFVAMWNLYMFIAATILWIIGYYSLAFFLNIRIMKKPFDQLVANFQESQGQSPDAQPEEKSES